MNEPDCREDSCTPEATRSPRFRPKREAIEAAPVEWQGMGAYAELEERVLAALRTDLSESEFDSLALAIHAFQKRHNEPYARWCATLPPAESWREIPAVPQAMFKRFRLACFPPALSGRVFRTSGTTGETRGEHHLINTRIYEASVRAGWDRCGFPPHYQLVLSQSEEDAPNSSLTCMWAALGTRASHQATFARANGALAAFQLAHTLDCLTTRGRPAPVALLGTALGFLNFLEQEPRYRTALAPGSFIVETGGFKGSGREISKGMLYRILEERLGVPESHIWNEYGMCELGSQFYTRGIGAPHEGGPWVRAVVVSPDSGEEVAPGEIGVLRVFDLANLGSVLAIQTADLAIRRGNDFELIGRDPAALPRGCSRSADESMRSPGFAQVAACAKAAVEIAPAPNPDPLTTQARASALANAAAQFAFLAGYTERALLSLVEDELGHDEALDCFVPRAGHHSRAIAPRTVLHIVSGNTPAAALQSLIHGLLLGSHNLCKLPSSGVPEVARFIDSLPDTLASRVECSTALPDDWLARADALVVFGNDATIAHFRMVCRDDQVFVPHGHRVSFGIFFERPDDHALADAARDASVFDQQGCLSPHVFFVRESDDCTARDVAMRLADAMDAFDRDHPRSPVSVSEANSIASLRSEFSFRAANGEPVHVFASTGTRWTVIADRSPGFPLSPLNRFVTVKPLPADLGAALAPLRRNLSTCGIWPATHANASFAAPLGVSRVCPIGRMQSPPATWRHDGHPVLAPLVTWLDFEGS